MGEARFKLGEPKLRNEAARKRVQDLTIYDSQTHHETLLSHTPTPLRVGAGAGAVFCLAVVALLIITWVMI